ncbi:two-component system response regulator [Nitrosomonas supralitoralis]|uniref:Diguanylate cyclase n=1 Tax=Nitrosomonas supralitoralis TaxID=2116706 RepID=A0A2P7NYQ2_9PROT|nr:EAL domain-containing protein [Nitrosomonas supralitoralis]PSJ18596.1 diguanylate cyclase [Nitrosomonas supralitoralis]
MTTKNFKILLADDDATVRILAQAALENAGFEVMLACNGTEAIRLFEETPANMIMLDVEMPDMDGYSVCSYIRKKIGNELPIIMVTGMDDVQSINRAFEVGATDFIAKPINWNLLSYRLLYLKRAYLNLLALKVANARSAAILSAIPDTMFIINDRGIIMDICSHADTASWLIQDSADPLKLSLPEDIASLYLDAAGQARRNGTVELFEYPLKPSNDKSRYYENRIAVIDSEETLCLVRDITDRKDSESKIFHLAYFDNLTGLPNRQSFMERLKSEIKRAHYADNKLAILFLDLDGFKSINDTMGHNAGDTILKCAADRLHNSTRHSDFVSRTHKNHSEINLARLGGDEFTVIIPNLSRAEDALILAHRIRKTMRRPFHLESRDVVLTTSIGIALYPNDGDNAETLLKHADTAMYYAKNEGRDNCQFYNADLTLQAEKRMHLENDLRNALQQNEFYLVYQPQLDITEGNFQSVEALIRWQHPEQGIISPLDFIPLAEENGLIIPIGEWVLRTACAEAVQWHNNGQCLDVAVNLSPMQIKDSELVNKVLGILTETGFPPNQLVLEITEGALMEHNENTLTTLHTLRNHQIKIALDDFGTGYSSMNYLRRLPINYIKVDQSFVRDLLDNKDNLAIVRAMISLSMNLGFSVTAEGIETLRQAQVLKYFGCNALQGYYFSKPISAEKIHCLLNQKWSIQASSPNAIDHENS